MKVSTTLLAFAASVSAQDCTDYHYVYARGTGDLSGFGTVGTEVNVNLQQCLGSLYSGYAIPYPANFTFGVSSSIGIQLMSQYITEYAAACPSTKFFVGGYSQGGIVLHGALRSLDPAVKAHIIAGSTFGDPGRNDTEGLPNWQSFCNLGDPVCVNGNNFNAHLAYIGDGSGLLSAQFFEGVTPVGNTSEACATQASFSFPPQFLSTTNTVFPIPTGGAGSSPSAPASVSASSSKAVATSSRVVGSSSKIPTTLAPSTRVISSKLAPTAGSASSSKKASGPSSKLAASAVSSNGVSRSFASSRLLASAGSKSGSASSGSASSSAVVRRRQL